MWLNQIRLSFEYILKPANHNLALQWQREMIDANLYECFMCLCYALVTFNWQQISRHFWAATGMVLRFKVWRQNLNANLGPRKLTRRVLILDPDLEYFEIAPRRFINAPYWLTGENQQIVFDIIYRVHEIIRDYMENANFYFWEDHHLEIQYLIETVYKICFSNAPWNYKFHTRPTEFFSWEQNYQADPFFLPPPNFERMS